MKTKILFMGAALAASSLALADASDYQWARVVDVEPIRELQRTLAPSTGWPFASRGTAS